MPSIPQPRALVLAGPSGAGKTTVSRALIRDQFGIRTFVNADTIAQGLPAFTPDASAIAAGRQVPGLHRPAASRRRGTARCSTP